MVALTKSKKRASPTTKHAARRALAPEPAVILVRDIKRIAGCTDVHGRWDLGYIELSPVGLCATNGRLLAVLNAPGWPYQFYVDATNVKHLEDDAELNVNGKVFFVSRKSGQSEVAVPHSNPDEVNFPVWQGVLPEAQFLQPVATLSIGMLKRLLTALQRTPDSRITLYVRPDDCLSPVMLCNESGDLGLLMPLGVEDDEAPACNFPTAVYQALKKDTQTIPVAWIPKVKPQQAGDDHTPAPSNGGGLLGG
jgi:hypothetical protein